MTITSKTQHIQLWPKEWRKPVTKVGSCGHQRALYKWTRPSLGRQLLQYMIKCVPPSMNLSCVLQLRNTNWAPLFHHAPAGDSGIHRGSGQRSPASPLSITNLKPL